jgi:response regulator RpfG family c-di-GMP phosphodiesterase
MTHMTSGIQRQIHEKAITAEILSKPTKLSDVEAMVSHRPYRPAIGIDAALEEIAKNKGFLYNPLVVHTCLRLIKEKGFLWT